MVRRHLFLLGLLLPSIAQAQIEDAEHRADRLRTIQLNRQAAAVVQRRDRGKFVRPDDQKAYRAARKRYQRQMSEWRERVADCNAGYYEACDEDR